MDYYYQNYSQPKATEGEYQDYEYQQFNNNARADEDEQVTMFDDQKTKYINFGAMRANQPQSCQPPPANTWHRGHSKCYRCRG